MSNYNATTGTDTVTQTDPDNTVTVLATNTISGVDFFNGAGENDEIVIGSSGAGTTDLSTAGTDATHGFHNYEGIRFGNSSGTRTAIFNAAQFGNGLISTTLKVTGTTAATQILRINDASNFSAAAWSFTNWDGTDLINIIGTSLNDVIVGSIKVDTING